MPLPSDHDGLELPDHPPTDLPRDHSLVKREEPARALGKPTPHDEHDDQKSSNDEGKKRSEHDGPDIDLKPIGTFPIILMVAGLLVLLIGLFVLGWLPHHQRIEKTKDEAAKRETAKPIVSIVKPEKAKAGSSLVLPGTARAFQSTAIYPRASGYLKRRLVDIGDKVESGQLLAEIETPEVDAQYAAAVAALEQARANVTKSTNDLALADSTLTRYEGFAQTGGVTQQALDEKRSTRDQDQSTLENAKAAVKAGEAELQRLAALTSFQKIYAPFGGTITLRNYDAGALLTEGTGGATSDNGGTSRALFEIDETDVLRVYVDVPQANAGDIHLSQPAQFLVRNDPGNAFVGAIARSAGAIDEQTRTLRVEADFKNPDGRLLPGMYGNLKLDLKRDHDSLVVPSSALLFGPEGTRLATVGADNKIKMIVVQVGRDLGTQLEITQGLKGDERIVANPGERLGDGVEVTVADAKQQSPQSTTQPQTSQQPDGSQAGPDSRQQGDQPTQNAERHTDEPPKDQSGK